MDILHCCGCDKAVIPRLTDGEEIYPHREDLYTLPFWKCDTCGNFVGCHHKTKDRTKPLGCIPTPEIKRVRQQLHAMIDPIWKSGKMARKEIYAAISARIGKPYHSAEIRSRAEANDICKIVAEYE